MPLRHHLKHWFIPHKRNNHRPHLIRPRGLAIMAILIITVQVAANIVLRPASVRVLAYATDITPVDLLNLTNQERANAGLPPLHLDARLNQSSALKAQNMFDEDYWAHVSPSGIQPWHWFDVAGYPYKYAGENLARDFDTSAGVMQGWMNSPGHRANILNANYTDVGFAVQNGVLTGSETTLVVAHYGAVASTAVAAVTPAPKPAVKAAAAMPTPAPTVAPTPTPASTPSTPAPKPVVASGPMQAEISNAPPPVSYSLFNPLSLVSSVNWGTLTTIILLAVLLLTYMITHLTVWQRGLRRWQSMHYRMYAAAQVSGLTIAIVLLAVSGFGRVG